MAARSLDSSSEQICPHDDEHPDAQMFGSVAGTRYDISIGEFIELAAKEPGDTGNHRARILSGRPSGFRAPCAEAR